MLFVCFGLATHRVYATGSSSDIKVVGLGKDYVGKLAARMLYIYNMQVVTAHQSKLVRLHGLI